MLACLSMLLSIQQYIQEVLLPPFLLPAQLIQKSHSSKGGPAIHRTCSTPDSVIPKTERQSFRCVKRHQNAALDGCTLSTTTSTRHCLGKTHNHPPDAVESNDSRASRLHPGTRPTGLRVISTAQTTTTSHTTRRDVFQCCRSFQPDHLQLPFCITAGAGIV